jgi:hypothetical protein
MVKARMAAALVAGWLAVGGGPALSQAAPPPAVGEFLGFRPKQDGVVYTTPTAQEQAACRVTKMDDQPGASGWVLRDAQGRPVRRYYVQTADKLLLHVWSYYLDGVEVYREVYNKTDGKPNHFRWLNGGGSKWGIDVNGDGKIDTWRTISAEEVSQEILQAVITKDYARLQALWITDADVKALELPAAEVSRLQGLQKQAYAKFQATTAKLTGLGDKTRWVRLEASTPQCLPADQLGGRQDVIKYAKAAILYENNGKADFLQTGELIQVGAAWRIVDAPTPGDAAELAQAPTDPALQGLLDKLRELDAKNSGLKAGESPGVNPEVVRYNLERANVLEQIVGKVKPEERVQWINQVADCLSTAAQSSPEADKAAYNRLVRLEQQIVEAMPGSNLAAYVTFREMSADYAVKLAFTKGQDLAKVQDAWLARLAKFVEAFPKADDAPDALLQLGMVSEFAGKEIEAKKWYDRLVRDFGEHQLTGKARGALKRLELEGKPLELAGNLLQGGAFNLSQLQGKVVAVYYWASWNQQCVGDFAKLKLLLDTYGSKGLALVCVNLDGTAEEATAFLQKSPAPGVHVFAAGGLDSPLALQYGVMVLPNLFLVDKDGKVLSRTVQVNGLEDEVKKLLK